jgi:hypothetical protein
MRIIKKLPAKRKGISDIRNRGFFPKIHISLAPLQHKSKKECLPPSAL